MFTNNTTSNILIIPSWFKSALSVKLFVPKTILTVNIISNTFIISSKFCDAYIGFVTIGCNEGNFYNNNQSDIIADYLYLPLDGKGTITLIDNLDNLIDSITYDIDDESWEPFVHEESMGHSLRLNSPLLDNSLSKNWSLSSETENSLWLYEEDDVNKVLQQWKPQYFCSSTEESSGFRGTKVVLMKSAFFLLYCYKHYHSDPFEDHLYLKF